ncbi:hypothetical protein BN1058_01684 [Paraliobacillus sp. PM-2]|uniref:DUF5107 domain-containing protein n=1 Tax=Paraliobacillus sp. PM-2 TaxID=1462524 RepID=UPI00061BE72E|nr:DUF5107 domain-containing protein [Paraliobacillus sp. PM-2]CQR47373.1 hypothetical protein BN1058_01684 [Paraliobacillus sp. PM-2]
MIPTIQYGYQNIKRGKLGNEASVPDLIGGLILQNDLEFYLDEGDEIYGGYGTCVNSYPYRQFSSYSRKLEESSVKTIVLENNYLKAVFLPELGGRLWSLWDKQRNRNLLYTNDVIRFSNLAIRNAWFSGGVEWNVGVIGHSPFTTTPLYTAVLEGDDGVPILRMYEYERIRGITYQMDFWLGEKDAFLNARMRIVNIGEEVVPMYWWSNIAVPEHENGRIVVPADQAYTFHEGGVYKVDIPVVDGVDITKYNNIPAAVDYFFDIQKDDPKYIAHMDEKGYGLLHMSTSRLQSRKLFTWGSKQAADHWQEFLTDDAGRYIEIQAGLGKTQYGCLPMEPNTSWEWLERYGAFQLEEKDLEKSFEEARETVTKTVASKPAFQEMGGVLSNTKDMAKQDAKLCQKGSGFGALKNTERNLQGKCNISEHLEFHASDEEQIWRAFLETGVLEEPDSTLVPPPFMVDEVFFEKLKKIVEENPQKNWYAHYQLGIFYFQKGEYLAAEQELRQSNLTKENAWAYHGLASVYVMTEVWQKAIDSITKGIRMRKKDMSYLKEAFRILSICEGYEKTLELYQSLDEKEQNNSRLTFYYIFALYKKGQVQKAYDLLCADGGLVVEDIREGEIGIGELWRDMHKDLFGEIKEIPYQFDFTAI